MPAEFNNNISIDKGINHQEQESGPHNSVWFAWWNIWTTLGEG